ncbi:ABC transporter ATP-binding protein [Clostridium gasigenes]|uniref:ABC transporter ATP-binding protein n=1 Tax=Clostridium gasigenes TaxID=94869 RepID=UPI001C0D3A0E|nr:ABC transporter ATP-binding protein [Clostridium gasigenes]MBU3132075.1 ABC transporter ATP-binding protein [Clostridium gasigenes]
MEILKTTDLKKYYGEGENQVKAIDGVDISVEKGEFITIVGSSGSGKSTLLHLLGGLDNPTSGKIIIDNNEVGALSYDDLCVFRRRNIGFIFQSFNLLPVLSVYENIVLPIRIDGQNVDKEYVEEIMKNLGIWNKKDVIPSKLSGGQQQRAAIARALASRPAIILADEPTGNLDSKNSDEVVMMLKECAKKYYQTILLITHEPKVAMQGDRILKVEDGKVTE